MGEFFLFDNFSSYTRVIHKLCSWFLVIFSFLATFHRTWPGVHVVFLNGKIIYYVIIFKLYIFFCLKRTIDQIFNECFHEVLSISTLAAMQAQASGMDWTLTLMF